MPSMFTPEQPIWPAFDESILTYRIFLIVLRRVLLFDLTIFFGLYRR